MQQRMFVEIVKWGHTHISILMGDHLYLILFFKPLSFPCFYLTMLYLSVFLIYLYSLYFNVYIISFILGYDRTKIVIDQFICTFQSKTLLHLTYTYILAIIGFSIFDRCCEAYNFSWLYGYKTQSHMIVMIFNNAKTEYKWTRCI